MTFTTEYELMLRAVAFAFVITAWIIARLALGQPVPHPWLGSLASGLVSVLAACVTVIPGSGPIPDVLTTAGVILTSMLFSAGVRFEATGVPLRAPAFMMLSAVAAAIGLLLDLIVHETATRIMIVRFCVGAGIAASLIWAPRLLRPAQQRVSALSICIFAAAVLVDRALPLVRNLAEHGAEHWNFLLPYVERSDIAVIVTGGIAMLLVSAERAHRERVRDRVEEA